MRFSLPVFLAAGVAVVVWCALLSPFTHERERLIAYQTVPVSSAVFDDDRQTDADLSGTVDLYGNEVADAVAKYSLDETGTRYEVHSPQIELPRLASPIS